MELGSMFGEREAKLGIEIDDQDSLEDIEARWRNRFQEEGITVSPEELKDLASRTYDHFFDEDGQVRPESVENQ